MGTHIRVTDDLHEWLRENQTDGEVFEDVLREQVDSLGERPGSVRTD